MDCIWQVVNTNTSFTVVKFVELQFAPMDELQLWRGVNSSADQKLMAIHYTNGYPNSITVNSTHLRIRFRSDGEDRANGFQMTIHFDDEFGK